jgi:hypothetical protein
LQSTNISLKSKWDGGVTLVDENVTYIDFVPQIQNGSLVPSAQRELSPPIDSSSLTKSQDGLHVQEVKKIPSVSLEEDTWGKYALEKKYSNNINVTNPTPQVDDAQLQGDGSESAKHDKLINSATTTQNGSLFGK